MPSPEDELRRMTSPRQVGSFWRYLWRTNHWAYHNVPMSAFGLVVMIIIDWPWASFVFGAVLGVSLHNGYGSYKLWKERLQWQKDDEAWVTKMVETGLPRGIAQAAQNFILDGKTSAAAQLLIEHLKRTNPEARQHFAELDAMDPEERKRVTDAAMAEAKADIARKKKKEES